MHFTLMMTALAALLASYAAGSIPFGYLVARLFGRIDLREHGSGNIGATNVARTMGFGWGALVLFLDALKGAVPVLWIASRVYEVDRPEFGHVQVGCGLAAILGHMYPCWLHFRGGKGVATALGVVAILAPWATTAAAAAFGLMFAATRIVSLASMTASVCFAATELWLLMPNALGPGHWSRTAFSLAVPVLIIIRHRENIRRLWRGEEPRMRIRKAIPDSLPESVGNGGAEGESLNR